MHTLIVSLNPAVDCEWIVDEFRPVEKNEVHSERRWPGGKGINAARWLRWLGGHPQLFLPVGGEPGRELVAGLREEGLPSRTFPLAEPSRVNLIVTQKSGGPQYRLNPLWPRFTRKEARGVFAAVREAIGRVQTVVFAGALPRTLAPDTYARLTRIARRAGCRVVLDCDGEAFRLAVPEGPCLVKPNEAELAEWAGRKLKTPVAVEEAALALSRVTRGWVLVSLGERGGLLVNAVEGTRFTRPAPKVTVRNTVGAGDALVAAVVHAMESGRAPEEWLELGVRTGTAATQVPPGRLPERRNLRAAPPGPLRRRRPVGLRSGSHGD